MRKEGWGGERSRIVVRFSTCAMALRAGNTGKKGGWFAGVVFPGNEESSNTTPLLESVCSPG